MLIKVRTDQPAPETGVYACTSCGREYSLRKGELLPPCEGCNWEDRVFRLVRTEE